MTTIAELQIKIDSRQAKQGSEDLISLADAAQRASTAVRGVNDSSSNNGGIVPAGESRKVRDLTESIDSQSRKLGELARQRQALESSNIKSTQPMEYERLNRIIDANIALVRRQGNAIETLSEARNRDNQRYEQQVQQQLALQDRVTRATERRELVVTNATAREARQLEQTINGLSRQIAAQNEYNQTIERLDRARARGIGGPAANSISDAEYQSYVRLAEARRDAAFAIKDESDQVTRASNRLDTYIATLGRAERAQVEYQRAIAALNEAQSRGAVTATEYTQRLAQFAQRRDATIASANSNAAAEERFERQLRQTISAFDPALRAQQQYDAAVKILSEGLQNGALSVEQFNKALTDQVRALDAVKNAGQGPDLSTEYNNALRALTPYRAQLVELQRQQEILNNAKRSGLVVTEQEIRQYDEATAAIRRQILIAERSIEQSTRLGNSYKQDQAALRGLPAQITDIVVSLQGGQAPLTVLLQQGGQIKDQFGGIVPALRGIAVGVAGLITPLSVAVTVLGALAIAAYQGSQELVEFNRAAIQSRNFSGASASSFTEFRDVLNDVGISSGKAAQALTAIEASGKIAKDQFVDIAEAAILFERATGQALSKTIEDFTSLGKDPVDAALRLDEQYKFLTASVLAQVSALQEQGRTQDAVRLLQTELASSVSDTAQEMIDQAGSIERAWYGVRDAVISVLNSLKEIGRDETTADRIAALQESNRKIYEIRGYRSEEQAERANSVYARNAAEIRQLQQKKYFEDQAAEARRQAEQDRQKDVTYIGRLESGYKSNLSDISKVKAAQEELNRVNREAEEFQKRALANGRELTQREKDLIKTQRDAAQQRLDDAKEAEARSNKNPTSPVDNRSLQEVRSNTRNIIAEYERYYKQVSALGEANVVSSEATYRSQIAVLQAQSEAVDAEYQKQISAIQALQSRKGNSASQNISLENQLTKAEADRVKAQEDNQSKQEQLTIRFQGDVEKRNLAIRAYTSALEEQVEALRQQGDRAVSNAGRGTRQQRVDDALAENDQNYARQQRRIAEALAASQITPEQQRAQLEALSRTHTETADVIVENDRRIQEANADWTNGFTRAIENARDEVTDLAGLTERSLTTAFSAAGDALATFATTGSLNFKSFATSVISDIARIAAQQAASGLTSSLLGLAATVANAYFTGGTNGFAAGSAGAQSSSLGASRAGYSSAYGFANGGAFDGGLTRFANGGTFGLTNSIVSTPTRFAYGGQIGEVGERGPEAILPLQRAANGALGVRVTGGEAGGSTVVNVVVNVTEGGTTTQTDGDGNGGNTYQEFGDRLGVFVRQEVYTIINKESRDGGSLAPNRSR